jgi:hypothetical protein
MLDTFILVYYPYMNISLVWMGQTLTICNSIETILNMDNFKFGMEDQEKLKIYDVE